MDSLQLSELDLQTFFGNNKDFSDQQSLPQVMLDATTIAHEGKYPGEGMVLPPPVVNFLDHGQSPDLSDQGSYYSDDSCPTPHHMPEFYQLTSPEADAPSTSFQWSGCSSLKRDHFSFTSSETSNYGVKHEEFGLPSCQQQQHQQQQQQTVQPGVLDSTSFPFVTSPSTSIPSPSSTIYSVSSPGTPGPSSSSSTRGRRPHDSTTPYSCSKTRRRHVEKGTQEYVDKRARNNVAVRKSRAKAREKQMETEGRVQSLVNQNEQLQKKVDLLSKELTVLKGLFVNFGSSIPDEFLKAIADS